MAKKKQSREDLAFPVIVAQKPGIPTNILKKIVQGAIKGAYHVKTPIEPGLYSPEYGKKQKPLVTEEDIQFVMHLIESLEPTNAIEAALASQFAITYIKGLEKSSFEMRSALQFFEFGHKALETLQKYRAKGSQLITVQYNHNQGQINNININKKDDLQPDIEV